LDTAERTILKETFTPRQIVGELDKYIIGQDEAKRSVAIALRNRARRQMLSEDMRDEVAPKNIILKGPTGVGKTEIARRLARLANAPFIKVEASKYTEVGYVGRDVESMVRDLADLSVNMVKLQHTETVREKAELEAEERLLDYLLPPPRQKRRMRRIQEIPDMEDENEADAGPPVDEDTGELRSLARERSEGDELQSSELRSSELQSTVLEFQIQPDEKPPHEESFQRTREILRKQLRDGKLEDRPVEIEVQNRTMSFIEIFTPGGSFEELDVNLKDMFGGMFPKQTKKRKLSVAEARRILIQEEADKLIDMDKVIGQAISRVENSGIIFLDELDKIAGRESKGVGPDVSREGVQRDILPIVEGCTVATKYGMVRTDHILFIAAGAFHVSDPSDLIPELQGRFPIRVELTSLDAEDFKLILTEPKNALVKQYTFLLETEGINVTFTGDAIDEIAALAFEVNQQMQDIGARRLHTVMEKLFEEVSFNAPDLQEKDIGVDAQYVRQQLSGIVKDKDLSRYIL